VSERLPRHIKRIDEIGPLYDDNGTPYVNVTVTFRWWYVPIALWHKWRSRPFGASPNALHG